MLSAEVGAGGASLATVAESCVKPGVRLRSGYSDMSFGR